ncbi:rab11 family-interacting protein 4 isoform X1 [Xenopus laevis]|uniref:Rab11 family-interacting protein 4 isoform X1 n=1 Tax=Xenopus laevis TaxID=8355 RepID=A0A8J0TTW5_XENLA|nr:rab11 family-interacting protein 4 isoform X1 [Xenopus laevis]
MERGGCSPGDQAHLVLFLHRLKQVFDVCDEDADGFIKVEHFIAVGLQFAQGDEVEKLAKRLDANAQGRISFKDFCHGVLAIKGCDELVKGILGVTSTAPLHYETQYTPYYYQSPEITEGAFLDTESTYSDSEFFAYEDGLTLAQRDAQHESDLDSAIYSTPSSEASDECRNEDKAGGLASLYLPRDQNLLNPSPGSDFSTHSTASLISNEEQFEDYGEGDDVDYSPGSPCPDDESRTNALSDLGSSVPSSAGQTPRKTRHVYNSELLDIYCTQCSKKITLLNDLEARLKNLKANSPNRKISTTAFGRQLFHNSNLSSSNGSTEDLFRDSIDSCENDITEKVGFLEKKVTELENDNLTNGDVKNKLKQENIHLVHRVHELEELLKDQETWSEQVLDKESKRHRETYSKLEKEKCTEIELLSARVQELEEENEDLLTSLARLKTHTVKIDEERQRMSDKLEDTSLRLKDEMDLYKKMMDKLKQNRLHFQKEREATQDLIEDLRRELEHLQIYKLECEKSGRGRGSSSGLTEFNVKTREGELEQEIRRLKQDNQKLRDQNDDLSGQILSLSLYEAKNLFSTQSKAQSLAAEIDSASKDELMEALKEQEDINYRLRQYMDKIILAILDHDPSILEIKN